MQLPAGTKLSHYEVVDSIGAGVMGEVYRARDTKLGRDVAITLIRECLASIPIVIRGFAREAQQLAKLDHPNIATIYGLDRSEEHVFLVTELVEGATLSRRMLEGAIPVGRSIDIALKIAAAMQEAHGRNIVPVHVDPVDVLLTRNNGLKLLNLGVAQAYMRH